MASRLPEGFSLVNNQIQTITLLVTVMSGVMTKVTPGLPILDFNGSRCPNQTLGCTIPNPWALIEIYWTWPINEPRHVLRNNQFGSLMNVWNFSWINVTSKDQRFNLETSKVRDMIPLPPGTAHAPPMQPQTRG